MTHLQAEWQPIPEVFFSGNPLVPSRNGAALRRRNRAWSCDRTGGCWGPIFHTAIVGSQYVPIICVNITCIHHAFLLRSNLWNTWLKSAETWWRNLAGDHLVGAMRWQHGCTVVPWAWSSCFEAKPRNFVSFQYVLMRKVPAGCFSLLTSYKDPTQCGVFMGHTHQKKPNDQEKSSMKWRGGYNAICINLLSFPNGTAGPCWQQLEIRSRRSSRASHGGTMAGAQPIATKVVAENPYATFK